MISIGSISSAGGASEYYTATEYYIDGESKSSWGGGAREAVGLKVRTVGGKALENLLNGKSADGTPLTDKAASGQERHLGIDITFSAPKSFSILAQGPLRKPLLKILKDANAKAMAFAETHLVETRVTDPESKEQISIGDQKIVYASFVENTSRANDPDLHIHNPLPNLALGEDGKFRAMHNRKLFNNSYLLGAVFRAEIAKGMRSHGIELRDAGPYGLFEAEKMPQGVIDQFSKRRAQILEMKEKSTGPAKDRSKIALISRPAKETIAPEALNERWAEELKQHDTSFAQITKDVTNRKPVKTLDVKTVLKRAIQDISETERHWTHLDILKNALQKDIPQCTANEILSEINVQVKSGQLKQSKDGRYLTTSKILRREAALVKEMRQGDLKGKVIANTYEALTGNTDGFQLTNGQERAARLIISSRNRFIAIQGNAGVGKTTMVKAAIPLAKEAGLKIVGLAPSDAAVEELQKTGVFDHVMTTQAFKFAPRGGRDTLIVLDEASMVGTESMLHILQYANKRNVAKVAIIGDVNQHSAIEPGTPFADMQAAGIRTAVMDEIIRQKNPRHRAGVKELADNNIREGFKLFAPDIHKVSNDNMLAHTVTLWKRLKNPKAAIVVPTNVQKAALNKSLKEMVVQDGPSRELTIWRPVRTTKNDLALAKTYKRVSHIRVNQTHGKSRFKKGQIYKVRSVDVKTSTVTLERNGHLRAFKPAKYAIGKNTIHLYQQDRILLNKGDRIRFSRGGRGRAVNNNDLGTIEHIDDDGIRFELDKGKTITLAHTAPELRHMDHGWANTGHSFQGKTVKDAIVLLPSRRSALTSLRSLYTGMSRHKENVSLITDNAQLLKENLEHDLKVRTDEMQVFRPEPEQTQENSFISSITTDRVSGPSPWLKEELDKIRTQTQDIPRNISQDKQQDRGR